jgi:hypothetical protein
VPHVWHQQNSVFKFRGKILTGQSPTTFQKYSSRGMQKRAKNLHQASDINIYAQREFHPGRMIRTLTTSVPLHLLFARHLIIKTGKTETRRVDRIHCQLNYFLSTITYT